MPLKQSEGLLSGYRAAKEQEALKKKHGINSPEVVVIEKKSAVAQIWRSTLAAIFLAIRIFDHRTRSTGNWGLSVFIYLRAASWLFLEIP
ncbi:MAG: hypothetical protein ACLRWF_11190 [Ruthenibacterium sp.]